MFKIWYSNFYNQLAKLANSTSTSTEEAAETSSSHEADKVVLVEITAPSSANSSTYTQQQPHHKTKNRNSMKNNSAKNSYRNAKKANKNFKPNLNLAKVTHDKARETLSASSPSNNNKCPNAHTNNKEFSNLLTNTFQSLVHYGDNIGAKVVKCLINENLYETQSLINQDYDIYQVIVRINSIGFTLKR